MEEGDEHELEVHGGGELEEWAEVRI